MKTRSFINPWRIFNCTVSGSLDNLNNKNSSNKLIVKMALSAASHQQQQQQAYNADQDHQAPISVDTQHDDMVHDVQLDYYGCKMATCSSGKLQISLMTSKF